MKELILASASKRRTEILSSCGIMHRVAITDAKELHDKNIPISKLVVINAEAKTKAAAPNFKDAVILGADTLVAHGKDIIGKPKDEASARRMLSRFSGSDMEVYTGLCVIDTGTGKKAKGVAVSKIIVEKMTAAEMERYFKLLSPYDRAGGFSIEGAGSMIFDNIHGSYFNILGLPMIKLKDLFRKLGLNILDFVR